jgi:5'-nucleotidase
VHSTNRKLQRNIAPYKVFSAGKYRGFDLAIVAVTTETTKSISNPGEGTTFEDPVAAVKRTVAYIKRHHRNVKRFVALTHIGYSQDIALAQESTDISLIIGGHSHTLLGGFDSRLTSSIRTQANDRPVTSRQHDSWCSRSLPHDSEE